MSLLLLLIAFRSTPLAAQDHTLAILNAGVESSEDAPFVSTRYVFLPGDYLYCSFQIAGFAVAENTATEARDISLSYEVSIADDQGRALAPSQSGEIKVPLHPEDKNWVPKRRVSFLLPSFVAAGTYHVHIAAKDLLSHTDAAADAPFHIGGPEIERGGSLSIQHFAFLREDDRGEPLSLPAYRPGDPVYIRFDAAGFSLSTGNHYHIGYGIVVFGPDGKPFLSEPNAAQLEDQSFYPAQFLPCRVDVLTKPSSLRGTYIVELTLTDFVSKRTRQTRQTFTLE